MVRVGVGCWLGIGYCEGKGAGWVLGMVRVGVRVLAGYWYMVRVRVLAGYWGW